MICSRVAIASALDEGLQPDFGEPVPARASIEQALNVADIGDIERGLNDFAKAG